MLIKKGGFEKSNGVNLAVCVEGFTQSTSGAVGVVGSRVPGGKKTSVFLTTRGHHADNPARNSIEKLRNGFKVQRNFYKLQEGGIVVFKGAFKPQGGEAWLSQWANPLAYSGEDAKKYSKVAFHGVLRMYQDQNTGGHRGTFYDYHQGSIFTGKAPDGSDLASKVGAFYTGTPVSSFLIRALDEKGEVIGFRAVNKFFLDDGDGATRSMTPKEAGDAVVAAAAQMNAPGGYSVLPAARYPVSPKGISGDENGRSKLAAFLAAERAYVTETDDGQEVCAKMSFLKLSDPSPNGMVYVNGVYAESPYGPGVDPLMIGGLRVSESLVAEEDHAVVSSPGESAPEPTPAGEPAEDSGGDPFEGMEGYFEGTPAANPTPGSGR